MGLVKLVRVGVWPRNLLHLYQAKPLRFSDVSNSTRTHQMLLNLLVFAVFVDDDVLQIGVLPLLSGWWAWLVPTGLFRGSHSLPTPTPPACTTNKQTNKQQNVPRGGGRLYGQIEV